MSMNVSVAALSCALMALAGGLASSVQGQVSPLVTSASVGNNNQAREGAFTSINATWQTMPNALTLHLKGDTTMIVMPPSNPDQSIFARQFLTGYGTFLVGPTPVQITNVHGSANFKLAVGGGFVGGPPTANVTFNYSFYETDGTSFPPAIRYNFPGVGIPLEPIQVGNGFTTYNLPGLDNPFFPDPYVLSPGVFYALQVQAVIDVHGPAGYVGPTITATTEYGGAFTSGLFEGFATGFNFVTVPAPSGAAVLAAGGLLAARRRRR